jgi:hypothetical protein
MFHIVIELLSYSVLVFRVSECTCSPRYCTVDSVLCPEAVARSRSMTEIEAQEYLLRSSRGCFEELCHCHPLPMKTVSRMLIGWPDQIIAAMRDVGTVSAGTDRPRLRRPPSLDS